MRSILLKVTTILVASLVAVFHVIPSSAEDAVCSFSSQLFFEDYSFSVSSKPADECINQQLTIAVQQNAKLVSQFEKKGNNLTDNVWVQDLDDDKYPELIVISHPPANPAAVSLSVYSLDGDTMKESIVPAIQNEPGYRGEDTYSQDGVRIVRSYVLYRDGDTEGAPTGEKKTVSYMYRNRELLPVAGSPLPVVKRSAKSSPSARVKSGQPLKITGISVKSDYLEIMGDGPIDKYRIERISSPWRLIIDISGAVSAMPEKTVPINSLGISNARIGVHKKHLRIVLDSSEESLPTETVTPAENALRIGFFR